MARDNIKWHSKQLDGELRAEMLRRLRICGEAAASHARRNLSAAMPPAGLPGEFPHARTGTLRQAVTYEVDERRMTVRIGAPVEYALFLELGTEKMQPRPFLRKTLIEMRPFFRRVLLAPL